MRLKILKKIDFGKVMLFSSLLLVCGCSETSGTLGGAAVGTAGGAGIGYAIGGRGGAALGGVIGGLAGGAVGNHVATK